jgi:hypothetical protein
MHTIPANAKANNPNENSPVTANPSAEPTITGAALAVKNIGLIARK